MFAKSTLFVSLIAMCNLVASAPAPETDISLSARKAAGGPASMTFTYYAGPYTCANANTPPPTDGSAGAAKTFSIAEATCVVTPFAAQGAYTAKLTATPKVGSVGCYVQLYSDANCQVAQTNDIWSHAFNGTAIDIGNTVGCANPFGKTYNALVIFCG